LAGCTASTKLTNVWSDPTFKTNSLQKLVVVGIAQNPSVRRVFEDGFVASLKGQGVQALASYTLVGDGQLDSARVREMLRENACDGVFLTRLVDRKTVETYYPPTTSHVSAPSAYYGGWYGYYSTSYAYTMTPGYTVQNEVVNLETNLYRVSDEKLVWSALSESWIQQGASPSSELGPYIQQLVYALEKSTVVTKVKAKK
jgi:hypothetical protein